MAAVSSSPQLQSMPGGFQPFSLLNGNHGGSRDGGALKALLAEPLEFKETATVVNSLEPGERGWIEVNPLAKPPKSELPSSVLPSPSTPSSSSSPSKSTKKNSSALYSGPMPLTFPPTERALGVGLSNHGNTCYLNSVLQAVIHTPGLAHLLLQHEPSSCALKKKEEYCTMCSMRLIHVYSFNKPVNVYFPSVIAKHLKQIAKPLRNGRQEDSHEFLRFLIDGLQNSELWMHGNPKNTNGDLKYTSSIHQLFGGRLRSRVTCSKCGHPSDTFDAFLDLSVEVRQCSSVKAAFDKFVKMDRLEGANKYKCEKCKVLVNATKQLTIDEAPKALVVHLKRFTPTGGKIRDRISYDQNFDISPYMSVGQHGARYSLYAVVCHSGGGPHSGHYVAHVRSTDSKRWGYMDDSSVSPSGKAPLGLADAYVLFYIREKGDALSRAINSTPAAKQQPKNPFSPANLDTGKPIERIQPQQQQQQQREQPVAGPSRLPFVNGGGASTTTTTTTHTNGGGVKRPYSEVKAAPEESSSGSEEEDDDDDEPPAPSQPTQPTQPSPSRPPSTFQPTPSSLPFPLNPNPNHSSGSKPKHQLPPSSLHHGSSRTNNVPLPSPTSEGKKKKHRNREKKKARSMIDPYGVMKIGGGNGNPSRFELAKGGKSVVGSMKGRN